MIQASACDPLLFIAGPLLRLDTLTGAFRAAFTGTLKVAECYKAPSCVRTSATKGTVLNITPVTFIPYTGTLKDLYDIQCISNFRQVHVCYFYFF